MMDHPPHKDIRKFFYDRFSFPVKKGVSMLKHIHQCPKCIKKIHNLIVKNNFRHRDTDDKDYNSASPETMEHIKTCYGALHSLIFGLYNIFSIEGMEWYCTAVDIINNQTGIDNAEDYLNYQTGIEALNSFKASAYWISEINAEERFLLFRDIARLIILTWDIDDVRCKSPFFLHDKYILFIGEELNIPYLKGNHIAEEELWNMQKYWKKNP